jgi:putative glycosyltransferase (TIGR04372 family)
MATDDQESVELWANDLSQVVMENDSSPHSAVSHRIRRVRDEFYIFAAILDRALGECIVKNLYAASVACLFHNPKLVCYTRDDRPYKDDISALNFFANKHLSIDAKSMLPLDYFYSYGDRAEIPGAEQFITQGFSHPDLLLLSGMMEPTNLLRFDYVPYLAVPDGRHEELDQQLVDLGLDPQRWFCCVYYREPTYEFRPAVARRDVSPEPFLELTHWIIKELGGQVVRIGHPEMTEFPKTPGFVDLSRVPDNFMLQTNAAARARFAVTTNSGPAVLFGALGTPNAITNAISIIGAWRETDFLLPRPFVGPNGEAYDIPQAIKNGSWNEFTIEHMMQDKGFRPVDNSARELQAVAEKLYRETTDTTSWRERRNPLEDAKAYRDRPNEYFVNAPVRRAVRVVEFPELSPTNLKK